MKKHLFIVTYGRTGSTLLTGLLNSHPKIQVHGENGGVFYDLYRSLCSLGTYQTHMISAEEDIASHPFFGVSTFPFAEVKSEIAHIFRHLFPPREGVETYGFKEVRYDMPDLDNYLNFLQTHYTDACFLFLTRDHEAVLKSGFYEKTEPSLLRPYLTLLDARFHAYAEKYPERSFQITYQELLEFDRVRALFSHIGHEITEPAWRGVTGTRHSYGVRSFIEIAQESRLVLFDASKPFFEECIFESSPTTVRNLDQLTLTGIIVPRPGTGALEALAFRNAGSHHRAKVGIPSPGFAKKLPHHPFSAYARISFESDPPDLTTGPCDFDLVATFAHAGDQVIGRLFVSQQHP